MKRDMELALQILRAVQATPSGAPVSFSKLIEEKGAAEIEEHIRILIDAGLLAFGPRSAHLTFAILDRGYWLTWAGHHYLENAS